MTSQPRCHDTGVMQAAIFPGRIRHTHHKNFLSWYCENGENDSPLTRVLFNCESTKKKKRPLECMSREKKKKVKSRRVGALIAH